MGRYTSERYLFVFLFVSCFVISRYYAQIIDENNATNTTSIITTEVLNSSMDLKTNAATKMCREYSELIYTAVRSPVLLISSSKKLTKVKDCYNVKTLIVGGVKAEPKEFPHMVLLGYSQKVESNRWFCGGSLISKRWVLTAAHCEKIGASNYALWARLGDLNYLSNTDNAKPKDYHIAQRIIHPDYQPYSFYHDIALFGLEKDVEFSAYIRPICLNTDNSLKFSTATATGWGQIGYNSRSSSADLLKVELDIISDSRCNSSYSSSIGSNLTRGIDGESMLCAGKDGGGKDTCAGDSGGPLQIDNPNNECMHIQIGVTSFGKFCGKKNAPGVYTKVSNYISWIEEIVWPNNE